MKKVILIIILISARSLFAQPDSLWSRIYETHNGNFCTFGINLIESGFLIGGTEGSMEYNIDFHAVKLDSEGNLDWSITLNNTYDDWANTAQQLSDSTYFIVGSGSHDESHSPYGRVSKISQDGDSLWTREFGGRYSSLFGSCKVENDIILSGSTRELSQYGEKDAYMIRIDTEGNEIWHNVYGGETDEEIYDVIPTIDSGFAMVGRTGSGRGQQLYMVKTDSIGEEEWHYTNDDSLLINFNCIVQTSDGDYGLLGFCVILIEENEWKDERIVVKLDSEGNEIWVRHYGNQYSERSIDMLAVEDGGFVIGGVGERCSTLFRIDSEGEIVWHTTYSITPRYEERCTVLLNADNGGYVLIGYVFGDLFTIKTEPDPVSVPYILDPSYPNQYLLHSPYPNPFNSTVNIAFDLPRPKRIKMSIIDDLGRELVTIVDGYYQEGRHHTYWDAESVPAGMYIAKMQVDKQNVFRKLMLVK